jgi:hypothetical protein
MQINEKQHLIDAPRPSLFESAIICAVLADFGPIYQEVEAIRSNESNGDRLELLLSEVALKAVIEIRDSPYPERRQMIGDCYLNEIRFLAQEYDAMMKERFKTNIAALSYSLSKPGDGGTEQPSE